MRQELSSPTPAAARVAAMRELATARIRVMATTHWRSDSRSIVLAPVKPYDFLLAPLAGVIEVAVGGRPSRLAAGQALLVAAGTPHRGQRARDCAAVTACTLHLALRDAGDGPLLTRWLQPVLRCPAGWTAALARLHAVPDAALRHHLAAQHLRALLQAQERPEELLAPAPDHGRLAGLLTQLAERCAEAWDEAALAAAAGLSPAHLRALFRRQLGCSPHRHLVRLRVRRAGELVRAGGTVAAAAAATGFASVRGLRLAFRRELGCSPRRSTWQD